MDAQVKGSEVKRVAVEPLRMRVAQFEIVGTAPYVQQRFSEKAKRIIEENQAAGSTTKKGKNREAKNFKALYEAAVYVSDEGWHGQPAAGYRNALIDACRVAGFEMTRAKMSLFVLADGFDRLDATPLVRIKSGKPREIRHAVRNATGVPDIRVRAMFERWSVTLRIQYDADQFTAEDVANLLVRAGAQVGIGEGRPFSKKSAGMGWGAFAPRGEA